MAVSLGDGEDAGGTLMASHALRELCLTVVARFRADLYVRVVVGQRASEARAGPHLERTFFSRPRSRSHSPPIRASPASHRAPMTRHDSGFIVLNDTALISLTLLA